MAIFGQYQGGDQFNVAGNMRDILKGQQSIHDNMLGAVEKFNTARQEMDQLQAVAGSILGQYGVDEKGNPDATAPKYVHDMFKAVNKEGGLANMSKSQMLAGIKAYETGYGLEQQKLQRDAARENIRGANIANTAKEIELKRIQEAETDRLKIKAARDAIKSQIDKIPTTKDVTSKEKKTFEYEGETIELTNEELTPLLDIINNAKSTKEDVLSAKKAIEKLIYDKSRISKKYADVDPNDPNSGMVYNSETGQWEEKANPLFKEFSSAYDAKPEPEGGRREVTSLDQYGRPVYAGQTPSSLNKAVIDSYIATQSSKLQKSKNDKTDYEKAEAEIAAEEAQYRSQADNDPELKRIIKEQTDLQRELNFERRNLNEGELVVDPVSHRVVTFHYKGERLLEQKRKVAKLEREVKVRQGQYSKRSNQLVENIVKTQKAVSPDPYKADSVNLGKQFAQEEVEVVKEVQRSLYEQTDDEFALMTNYLRANGGVPASFTKEAFYASKGIIRPTIMPLGNGQTYVRAGGLEQIVKDQNVSGSQMTIMDQKRLYDAKQLATQSNMSGLNVNGYSFSGQLRVGDIDQANKVRDGVFKTTRALSAVDQMISIAENASMFDKLMPTEVSGIAQSLTNAAQAANRTEVGGSGSWSNQDQIYMDKVIRDPSSGFNTLFSSQTIASLKEYRRRLETSLHDSGTVYGFAFEKGGRNNSDGLDSQRQQFRVLFASYMAQGLSREEALQRAISDSEADYE